MRNHIMIIIVSFVFLLTALGVNAQMMGGFFNTSADWDEVVEHTVREEQEGKELWKKFQSEAVVCANFSDEQFGVLGEYFMGRMTGDSHAAMNAMMIQAHGEDGEEQIHIVMGKRLSGCDTHASIYGISGGWILIMNMMMGSSMMNFGYGFGYIGWIFMILWWVLLIAGIIALVKWLTGQSSDKGHRTNKSALEILKERYAKGEIEKKEFEKRKKDLI